MTIQEMKDRKHELGLSNEEIALRSGVPFSTVQKIFGGITTSPRSKTIKALEAVLSKVEQKGSRIQEESLIQEEPLAYRTKKQGEYTLEDYYAIPDEQRVELIDGVLYDMAAPSVIHQRILGQLYLLFEECISSHEGDCEVFLSPCDVQLDRDEKTMLQPDLFVLCREYDLKGRSIPGAPDLTVEILSDSTRAKDCFLKTYKYLKAGVREYWIIDPRNRQVLVYFYEKSETEPERYTFEEQIPIHISQGRCKIDFGIINQKIAAYYG